MGEVVGFKSPEELIWVCSHCKCTTFCLYSSGEIQCASCGVRDVGEGQWARELPEPVGEPTETSYHDRNITSLGSPQTALKHMMQHVNVDTLEALVAIESNSRVRTWGGYFSDDPDKRKWIRRQLFAAYQIMSIRRNIL